MNRIPRAIVVMLAVFCLAEFAAIALVARTTVRRVGSHGQGVRQPERSAIRQSAPRRSSSLDIARDDPELVEGSGRPERQSKGESAKAGLQNAGSAQTARQDPLDARVRAFLDGHRWHDLNVPEADGRALYDIVLKNGYKRALEIGTSTGHSGIWIAWALSKTGGRLITIDIDEGRQREAKNNFEAAGVAAFVDSRLADAHELVPRLEGPFDFVFIDADKDWYTNYAKAVLPKLTVGGSMTAHNVSPRRGWRDMTGDYYEYVMGLPFLESGFSAGVFVSRKVR